MSQPIDSLDQFINQHKTREELDGEAMPLCWAILNGESTTKDLNKERQSHQWQRVSPFCLQIHEGRLS